MKTREMLHLLLGGQALSLATWLADPLPGQQAEAWLREIWQRSRVSCGSEQLRFQVGLAELIARHWSGKDTAMDYQNLLAVLGSDAQRAQLKLCYGQLLIACRRRSAWGYLDDGFGLAANLLEPEEYFIVLRRHAMLRHLPLSDNGGDPVDLDGLLREAAVVSRLNGPARGFGRVYHGHQDTVD